MYKNKFDTRNNIAEINIRKLRLSYKEHLSQRALASKMQLHGIDIDKNAIQRIESGARFITDIELKQFADFFETTVDELLRL